MSRNNSIAFTDEIDAPKGEPRTVEELPPRDINGLQWTLVVSLILSSTFLFAVDNTIIAGIQPVIGTHFNAVGKLNWLSIAPLIGVAPTSLVWGRIYQQFNAKWIYILCVTLFEVGSAICVTAPSTGVLIVGRVISGLGGSGMCVGAMALLAVTTTIHERPLYLGGTGLTWGLGAVLGPIIGGAFTNSSAGWRGAFYINLYHSAVCAAICLFILPNRDPRPGVSFIDRAREIDYVGAALIFGTFASGFVAVSFGGIVYPWNSGKIIGLFVCSSILFIRLGIQQANTITSRRILPVEFFKSRTILFLFAMTFAGGTAVFLPIYMVPIFFQLTRDDTALEASVRLLPFIFLIVFAVIGNGAILSAYEYYMPWYTLGGILVITGGALMYTIEVDPNVFRAYSLSIIVGLSTGLLAQALFSIAQTTIETEFIASEVGFITCAQVSGVTIALAIVNSIFLNKSQPTIHAILPEVSMSDIQVAITGAGSVLIASLLLYKGRYIAKEVVKVVH